MRVLWGPSWIGSFPYETRLGPFSRDPFPYESRLGTSFGGSGVMDPGSDSLCRRCRVSFLSLSLYTLYYIPARAR